MQVLATVAGWRARDCPRTHGISRVINPGAGREPRGTSHAPSVFMANRSSVRESLPPSQAVPHGTAPGAKSRLLAAEADGVKHYVIVLQNGDEVATALADFAHRETVVNAHFVAVGAVHDAEVGWFDKSRRAYKVNARPEPMEVLTLSGDIALGENGVPVVHAHLMLGDSDGNAWGGHLLHAIASPTLEIYLTTFSTPLHKRRDAATGLQLIDLSIGS